MRDLLFLAADLWLMATTWYFGIRMYRSYRNHLLALEWLVVAVSSTNFLLWALLGGEEDSPMYDLAYVLDAFSRSFGFTLLVVLGLLAVTHGYRPPLRVKVGATALTAVAAVLLGPIHSDTLEYDPLHLSVAVFYVVANLAASAFLLYVAGRVWRTGATTTAALTALVTLAGSYVAVVYDFFPYSFDDESRTIFYTVALSVWGAQAVTYFYAYRALHDRATVGGTHLTTRREALA